MTDCRKYLSHPHPRDDFNGMEHKGSKATKKKREVLRIAREKEIDLLEIVETKIKSGKQLSTRIFFGGEWETISNIYM